MTMVRKYVFGEGFEHVVSPKKTYILHMQYPLTNDDAGIRHERSRYSTFDILSSYLVFRNIRISVL